MGQSGGGSTPEVKPAPKAEVTKSVTEAATTARQSQKDKANKAAGLRGSILTSDLNSSAAAGGTQQTTKLGGGA